MGLADRSNETSDALVEVRTVLSRAVTARDTIVQRSYNGNVVWDQAWWDYEYPGQEMSWPSMFHGPLGNPPDPDSEAMYDALTVVIEQLERWQKKRKRKR